MGEKRFIKSLPHVNASSLSPPRSQYQLNWTNGIGHINCLCNWLKYFTIKQHWHSASFSCSQRCLQTVYFLLPPPLPLLRWRSINPLRFIFYHPCSTDFEENRRSVSLFSSSITTTHLCWRLINPLGFIFYHPRSTDFEEKVEGLWTGYHTERYISKAGVWLVIRQQMLICVANGLVSVTDTDKSSFL